MNRYKFIHEGRKHIHTLDQKHLIGTTTAKSIIGGKEQLMQWYADMAAIAGLAAPQIDIKEEYEAIQEIKDWRTKAKAKKELDKKYPDYETARKAAIHHRDSKAKTGSIRHGVFENYIKECLKNDGKPIKECEEEIKVFVDWSLENVEKFYFTEANCYHEDMWVGGIADCGMLLKNGKRVAGDHKSSKEAYPDMFLQVAIYDLLLAHSGILDNDGNKLGEWELADGYVIFPFRSDPFTPEFKWNASAWRKGGIQSVSLYKLLDLEFSNPN